MECQCGGKLVLIMKEGTSYGSDASGRACCPTYWENPNYFFCDKCKIMYHKSIKEGQFYLIKNYPFWGKLKKGEICKNCSGFEGEDKECRGRYHTKSNLKPCIKFYPK
ncbi:MAG: hypothetical protein KKD44_28365 [Proteobacteria bacterium]|nr:hypothetical protein [Pseudomonadota bacterium]